MIIGRMVQAVSIHCASEMLRALCLLIKRASIA